ncbi:hypothetical protein KY312_00100, partial [Candidatus Woesearchaeota archaeon]|nr:hypothetical protein [Candidatus Woesearchaeota archaeon]
MKNKILIGLWIMVFLVLSSFVFGIIYAPGISYCIAEDDSNKGAWDAVCDGSYPGDCSAGGDLLRCNDAISEAHYKKNKMYAGVKIQSYNASITDCVIITAVELCYEWWYLAGSVSDCDISVDADGNNSWTAVTTACPGMTANPGVNCTDVTGLESWSCENFFGASGTRAEAKSEVEGLPESEVLWDAMYFNVSYVSAAPNITIIYPQDGAVYNMKSLFIRADIEGSGIDTCWYNLNAAGNTTFNCSSEPNISVVEGLNNLTVFSNNTDGSIGSESISFTVNSSIELTVSITSPANNTISTASSPKIKLLALDSWYQNNPQNVIDYTVIIYYGNDTLYSIANSGTFSNNTEIEIALSPALNLSGNITTYKIIANVTDYDDNNATSNILYYTLVRPAVELVSPEHNYWDDDGNITFGFKVFDETNNNLSCSLYIDSILNQTNSSTLTNGTLTIFNVTGLGEGADREWEIICTDPLNNTGQDSRTFNVDKTQPVINWINDTPDPVNQSNIINITANVSDNLGVKEVLFNISGARYYMALSPSSIYYYEYNTSGLTGNKIYYIEAFDNADNAATILSGNFTVESTD